MHRQLIAFCLLLFPATVYGQTAGPFLIGATTAQCASVGTFDKNASVGISVGGTWTGTLTPQGTIQGQTAFGVSVTPSTSGTPASSITANGAYVAGTAGLSTFQLCGPSSTGTAIVYLNGSQAWVSSGQTATPVSTTATHLVMDNTAIAAPGTLSYSGCSSQTPGLTPSSYAKLSDGTYAEFGCIDEATAVATGLPGTPEYTFRSWWNGTGVQMPQMKNRLVGIVLYPGEAGVTSAGGTQQISALGVHLATTGSDTSFVQTTAEYAEAFLDGTPTFGGHPQGEISFGAVRGNLTLNQTNTLGGGPWATFSANTIRNTTQPFTSCSGTSPCVMSYYAYADDLQNGTANLGLAGFYSTGSNSGGCTACTYIAYYGKTAGFTTNYGLELADFGTASGDYDLRIAGVNSAGTASGFNAIQGPLKLGAIAHAASGVQLDIAGGYTRFNGSSSGAADIGVAAAAGTPNPILLPTSTGTAGQVLQTDGGNPQQTSWTTPSTPIGFMLNAECDGVVGAGNGTTYWFFPASANAANCTGASLTAPAVMATACTASKLYVLALAAGAQAGSGVVKLYKNGSGGATALTCTLGTGTSCNDTTHSVGFSAGDTWSLGITTGQASDTTSFARAAFMCN